MIEATPAWLPTSNRLRRVAAAPVHQLADPAFAARLLGVDVDALLDGSSGRGVLPRDGTLLGGLFESLVTLSVRVYAQATRLGCSTCEPAPASMRSISSWSARRTHRRPGSQARGHSRRRRREAPALAGTKDRPAAARRSSAHHRIAGLPPPGRHRRHPRSPAHSVNPSRSPVATTDPQHESDVRVSASAFAVGTKSPETRVTFPRGPSARPSHEDVRG